MTDLLDLLASTHARTDDPDTSKAAAARLSDKATMMRKLLKCFSVRSLTSDEAVWLAGYLPADGAWKRVSDLAAKGLIEDTGERRPGDSGRAQMVRRITDKGREALRT